MADLPDFYAGGADVALRPEWAAIEGIDKNMYAWENDKAFGEVAEVIYTVPAGKTLYVTDIGWASWAEVAANGDLPQMSHALIYNNTDGGGLWQQGGNGGGSHAFSKPQVCEASHEYWFRVLNRANHNCRLAIHISGYEV